MGALLYVCNNCGFWRVFSSLAELLEVNENHCDSVLCPKCCDLMEQVQDDHKLVIVEHGAIERMKQYFRQAMKG